MHARVHGEVDKLTSDETGRGEHGNASVLDFGLLEPLDVEGVGEAEGVESVGTDESVGVGGVD